MKRLPERLDAREQDEREHSVECPRCHAQPGVLCIAPGGVRRREAHVERALLAQERAT